MIVRKYFLEMAQCFSLLETVVRSVQLHQDAQGRLGGQEVRQSRWLFKIKDDGCCLMDGLKLRWRCTLSSPGLSEQIQTNTVCF